MDKYSLPFKYNFYFYSRMWIWTLWTQMWIRMSMLHE